MILGPIAAGAGLLWLKPDHFRKILVGVITVAICGCVFALARLPAPAGASGFPLSHHWLQQAMLVAEAAMGVYVIYVGVRSRRPLIVVLMLLQGGLLLGLEYTYGSQLEAAHNVFVDKL